MKMLKDPLAWADRSLKGPDQDILKKYTLTFFLQQQRWAFDTWGVVLTILQLGDGEVGSNIFVIFFVISSL